MPATVGKLDAEVAVSGMTASSKDFLDTMKSHLPIVFLFVLSLAFILLLVTFRSIVIPIKAIILNLLSVGAAYGILTLVFQDGHGEKAARLHTRSAASRPGSRCSCSWSCSACRWTTTCSSSAGSASSVDRGMSTENAVAEGIKSTAGVITSAAAVMVVTFGAFATGSDQAMKQLGIGLAAAILIDATIVRAVLLPGHDEAARQAQLVPAQAAGLAAQVRARAGGGARPGLIGPTPEPDRGARHPAGAALFRDMRHPGGMPRALPAAGRPEDVLAHVGPGADLIVPLANGEPVGAARRARGARTSA